MSAFLGRIHYWLYNKVQLHEKLICEVVVLAKSKGSNKYNKKGVRLWMELL